MSNKKYYLLVAVSALVVLELFLDTGLFFAGEDGRNNKASYLASGRVDNLFPRTSHAKYINVVEDNVFFPVANTSSVAIKPGKSKTILPLKLRGVTITPDKKFAVIWDGASNKSQVVDEGETIQKWKVVSIESDRVVISSGETQHELFVRQEQDNRK